MTFPFAYLWLLPVGVVVGNFGTLIGVGGGFVLVPLLLLLYPTENPEFVTSLSLAVVFFNALSGSVAYARMRRIDYVSGLLLGAATVPGAILGAMTTTYIPRRGFDLLLGTMLLAVCAFLLLRPQKRASSSGQTTGLLLHRRLVERDGTVRNYAYSPVVGVGASLFIGYFSSLLGLGGAIIQVPVMASVLGFPVHVATATSLFVLTMTALTGTTVHVVNGAFQHGVSRVLLLSIGVLAGAQIGARLSNRVGGAFIMRGLALALGLVGFRILLLAFS